MPRLFSFGLKSKIILIASASLLVVSVFFSFQLVRLAAAANSALKIVADDIHDMMEINETSVLFKSQVQAWKNMLIRGHDPQNLEKYAKELAELNEKAKLRIHGVEKNLTSQEQLLVQEFLTSQENLFKSYGESKAKFLTPEAFNQSAADSYVKGKDRPVLESLDKLQGIINERVQKASSAAIESGLLQSILTALVLSLIMVVLTWILVSRVITHLLAITEKLAKSGETLKFGSEQLERASHTISSSATEAASSMQETVASIEEISSMIQRSTQHSQESARLAQQSAQSAAKGSEENSRIVSSMTEIVGESHKMEEIISAIDDIAFQTNLLALNAAVEAARAGDAGKGFAVVADAVRNLAQRSAEAAKEISLLIRSTTTKVESGSELVAAGSRVFSEIVVATEKVSGIISEIASGTAEQAGGITQINQAMNMLDKTTQGNASAASEVASFAAKVSEQAFELENHISGLKKIVTGR